MKKKLMEQVFFVIIKRVEDEEKAASNTISSLFLLKRLIIEINNILSLNKDDKRLEWALERWIDTQTYVGKENASKVNLTATINDLENILKKINGEETSNG